MPSNSNNQPESNPSRLEKILAYMAVGVIGLSVISILVTLISQMFESNGGLVIFRQIPVLGLPLGFILVLVLLFVSMSRRAKEARKGK
jgi:cation transporter-like permease